MGLGKLQDYDKDCSLIEDEKCSENVLRLDLGCGKSKKEGFIGVDISHDTDADIIIDLNLYPWIPDTFNGSFPPAEIQQNIEIPDSSVFEIHCSHFIEHVVDLVAFMAEIHRILIPGGIITFYAPYYTSIRAWQDPTHRREISENTFLYFSKKWMELNKLTHYNINVDFDTMSTKFLYGQEWRTKSDEAKEWARRHYFNVVDDIEIVMKAIK